MSALRYPLDVARQSLWHQIANQALPARPEGFFLSEQLYRASLHPYTPISIGLLYLFGVVWANQRYRAQKGKSKDYVNASPTLKNIVLAHNILLAVYSCWTSVNVVARLVSYFSRGFKAGGAEGLACAFCTVPVHDASADGLLRFVVLFYYSKFYEVIDSLVLVLKGKRVSNLQVYHHFGAMMTMFAGAAFSASPIWIFAAWNGFVHTWMYAFYAATSLGIRVPSPLKKGITMMQIHQLFFGMLLASSYFIVTYIPSAFPDHARPSVGVAKYSGAWTEAAGLLAGNATLATSPTLHGSAISDKYVDARIAASLNANGRAPCMSSTGQAFALALNVGYLIPLIALFVNFYANSYIKKLTANKTSDKAPQDKKQR